jgi:hypothetical protein
MERGAELIGQIGAQEGEREVAEIDEAQQAPAQAEPERKEPVEPSREQPRHDRLPEEGEARHYGWMRAPGAANSFGHTTSHFPSCTWRSFERSSP